MTNTPISIAIITKDRAQHLSECLRSLQAQRFVRGDELIVIDSSPNKATKLQIQSIKHHFPIPITYVKEPIPGFPVARNRAIKKALHAWSVFIDDDCIASRDWVSMIRKSIRKRPGAAVIAGATRTYYRNNVYSIAVEINELFWKIAHRRHGRISDLETIDNKNTIYNTAFLKKNRIAYDEKLTLFNGGSEDCDHGRQIQQAGGKGYYNNSLLVFHKDTRSFFTYFSRVFVRSGGHAVYEMKWASHKSTKPYTRRSMSRFLILYFKKNRFPPWFILRVLWILGITFLFVKIVKTIVYIYNRLRFGASLTNT